MLQDAAAGAVVMQPGEVNAANQMAMESMSVCEVLENAIASKYNNCT